MKMFAIQSIQKNGLKKGKVENNKCLKQKCNAKAFGILVKESISKDKLNYNNLYIFNL